MTLTPVNSAGGGRSTAWMKLVGGQRVERYVGLKGGGSLTLSSDGYAVPLYVLPPAAPAAGGGGGKGKKTASTAASPMNLQPKESIILPLMVRDRVTGNFAEAVIQWNQGAAMVRLDLGFLTLFKNECIEVAILPNGQIAPGQNGAALKIRITNHSSSVEIPLNEICLGAEGSKEGPVKVADVAVLF